MVEPGKQLKFSTFVDGELVAEAWAPLEDAETIGERHAAIVAEAVAAGRDVRLEVFDPTLPPQFATMRMGTSPDGMTNPIRVATDDLDELVDADYRARHEVAAYFERTRKPKDDA